MAFSYPYSFVAKTVARANQVMANFDAIKEVLDGGISGDNLAPGYKPTIGSFTGGGVTVSPINELRADLITAKTFEVDGASRIHFDFRAQVRISPPMIVVLEFFIDGNKAKEAQVSTGQTVTGAVVLICVGAVLSGLAAGTHTVALKAYAKQITGGNLASPGIDDSGIDYVAVPA